VTRLAVTGGALVVGAGAAVLLVLLWARPGVSVSSSRVALLDVRVTGLGTRLTEAQAATAGRPLVLVHEHGGLVPTEDLAQGQRVQVTATASPPSWLRWLVGGRVKTTRTFTTPVAAPVVPVALAGQAGTVPVRFDQPVSVVAYRFPGASTRVVRMSPPATLVNLVLRSPAAAGTVEVAAAPQAWEAVADHQSTVTWFDSPSGAGAPALVNPAPGQAGAISDQPIVLTFAQPVATVLGATRPSVSPTVPGSWSEPSSNTLVFTPMGFGFGPGTAVTVSFDRPVSVAGSGGRFAPAATTYGYRVSPGSTLRMEQIAGGLANAIEQYFAPRPPGPSSD
jgi:hypothetical protein